MMKVAVVQLSSQERVDENLARVAVRIAEAAAAGARLVALPENFAFMGPEDEKRAIAEELGEGPISRALADLARRHGVFVVAGGMPERSADAARPYNTSALFAPDGAVAAVYRKIHLFDVDLADGTTLRESDATTAGERPVVADVDAIRVGMTVCYDLRFPELYRRLVEAGAHCFTVPAAFTLTTGKDHWHVLLRARAIESQAWVLAPAQWGKHPRGRATYGKSLVVDPWGEVVAQASEGEGIAIATIDLAYQARVRQQLPCLAHRRPLPPA